MRSLLLFKGLSVTLPDMTEKIPDCHHHHHLSYMSYEYCCCGCYCCRPKQQQTEQDTELNMAGNEEDNTSAGSAGASGTASSDPDPDRGGMFDFRPPFLDDKDGDDSGLPAHLGPVKQLHSATGYNLAIDPTGKVYGTREPFNQEAVLEVFSQARGEIQIKGRLSQMYVAMNERGRIYAEVDPESPNTVFIESYENGWNSYMSKVHSDKSWFLGIKKSGKPKKGDKTKHGQKAVKFIPRPAYPRNP